MINSMLQYLVEKLPKHTDLIDRSTLSKKIVEMIKATLILSIVLFFMSASYGQSAIEYFNAAANQYIYESDQLALNTIDQGLQSYPADQNLATLREKIMKEQEQKENQDQQSNDDQNNKDEQQEEEKQNEKEQGQDQQKQDQTKQEQQDQKQQNQDQQEDGEEQNSEEQDQMGDEQQTQQQNESEEKGEEEHPQPLSRSERLEELNLTEEKARMILEAMKNSEIQYIQQNRRKPTKKPDSTKPDW